MCCQSLKGTKIKGFGPFYLVVGKCRHEKHHLRNPEAPAMSKHAKPVRMQKNTTPQPQTSASGPKKPSSASNGWAHSKNRFSFTKLIKIALLSPLQLTLPSPKFERVTSYPQARRPAPCMWLFSTPKIVIGTRMALNSWNHHEKQNISITKFCCFFPHRNRSLLFLKCDLDMDQNMTILRRTHI